MVTYNGDMKKETFIKVRVTEKERETWKALAAARGDNLSDMIRACLAHLAKGQRNAQSREG